MEKIPSVETLKATGVEGAADAFLLSAETKETLKKEGGLDQNPDGFFDKAVETC